ncbi:GIP [Symbiodinium microadriaticum]|nr:GIP [Symbiodinium microadriaticum]
MLPNGVLRHSPASPEVDMQSLPYSPLGLQAQGSTSGLLGRGTGCDEVDASSGGFSTTTYGDGVYNHYEAEYSAGAFDGNTGSSSGTDDASSASIPREMVEAEVKRQVQDALRSQQQGRDIREAPSAMAPEVHVDDQIHLPGVPLPSFEGGPYLEVQAAVFVLVLLMSTEAVYNARAVESGPTFGDYELDFPPGLKAPDGPKQQDPTRDDGEAFSAAQPAMPSASQPNPLDVLITGMSQLQQVLLRQKAGETLDLELKGVQELPKLPEYTPESGATDFQDYLYLTEQQVGSLVSGAAEWWQQTLGVAQTAYAEYQSLSPMKRLSVKASLTPELKADKYKKLERKVASLVLSSLPKGVRDELIAHRVQGLRQILFRLMVVFQPGGAQDRAQLLRQLDVSESSAGPAEAVVAIRRWYRLLQRAADLNIALPDESLQVRSLCNIVKKTAEQFGDFKFRVSLAKTELQIDSRPSQANVLRFLQHLLAELEQLGGGVKKNAPAASHGAPTTTATSTATAAPSLKGVQPLVDSGAGAKAKAKPGAPSPKKPCQWFGTDGGCRNGKQCSFFHSWTGLNRGERCLLCGSKHHRAKECGTRDHALPERPPPPPKATAAALGTSSTPPPAIAPSPAKASAASSGQAPSSSATTSSVASSGGTNNKIDAAKMTEILNETNKMLKAFTSQTEAEAPPVQQQQLDPLALIQQQLDEVRRLKAISVRPPNDSGSDGSPSFSSAVAWYEARLSSTSVAIGEPGPEQEALLDSGASHAYRAIHEGDRGDQIKTVAVTLATGEERHLQQTAGGTLLGGGDSEAIVPMGQLVRLLGCKVSWSPFRLTVVHPLHGKLRVRLRGNCPVLPISQAMTLIAELEQARIKEFEATIEDLKKQVKVIRERGREEWTWERHLRSLVADGDRVSMAGLLHMCPTFAEAPPEALLGLPESIPLGPKEGWKLLKGMPWSRSKRKSLLQSDNWVVHLCSGDGRTWGAREQGSMRRAFWNSSLNGDEVLLEVDLTMSRSMDLLQQNAVFRVLSWAALSGKIKSVVGGPPRHTFPGEAKEASLPPQKLKETKLLVRMLMLWYMAQEGRVTAWHVGALRQPPIKPHVGLLVEHPDSCGDLRSFFDQPMWKIFAEEEMMGEVRCHMNGRPTVLGGNLDLWHLEGASVGALDVKDPAGSVWPMELVAHVAGALRSWKGLRSREGVLSSLVRRVDYEDGEVAPSLAKFNAAEWRLHLQRDHLPYRRDCRICIERASGKPHRKVAHPSAYSLAVDLAGPFRKVGVGGYKYLMVGCYRFPKLAGIPVTKDSEPPEAAVVPPDDEEDWLWDDPERGRDEEPAAGGVGEVMSDDVVREEEKVIEEDTSLDKEVEALKELASPLEFTSVYLARPMKSRKKKDALRAVQELYVQLRSHGLPLCRLHMDRARELQTDALEAWAAARDIEVTRTQGSDPAGNGTAERAVGAIKARVRVLLGQAKELSGADDETIRAWWPFAAETAVSQHQAVAFGRKLPTVARFGSRVFTKRKGYGQGGRLDLLPRWLPAVYLGPARSVPGGHLVFTDEGNLWFTTNVRQFEEPPKKDEGAMADVEVLAPPARRVRRKSSVVELADGMGLMPGLREERDEGRPEMLALKAISALAPTTPSSSSEDVLEEDVTLEAFEVSSGSTTGSVRLGPRGDLAAECLAECRFSMNDCLEVLQNENFRRTKKQRASAWKDNAPPPVHTTLGAYQRGPWSGTTTATTRHRSLAAYLVAMFKHHCGQDVSFTSMTVARDLCTDAHRDRFNLRTSKNYVLTVGNFEGGGIWQEGERDDLPAVSVQNGSDVAVRGFVSQVRNQVVEVDPKKLHKTMPWEGGPKWTVIAHTVGQHHKLTQEHRDELQALGFNLPTSGELRKVSVQEVCTTTTSLLQGPGWFPGGSDDDEEMWKRMWARRLLDEEECLLSMLGKDEAKDFEGVVDANKMLAKDMDAREADLCRDRYDAEQWLLLCRLAEGENEVRGVEPLLETLSAPLKVVFTVALDEVKQYVTRWVDAIHKEAEALIKAKALVPLTLEEQKELEASGRLVVLPAKGVFTVKPPDQETLKDDSGRDLPPGSPEFFKRKARLVICGNFQGKQAKEDSYAGGCQTDSLRVMLVHTAAYGWMVASTDIRNAFILAPIKEEDEDDDATYALYPPKVFHLAKVEYSLRLWRVDRALYGFRRSPRLWGKFRDRRLRAAKIAYGTGFIYLRQHKADENIWSAVVVGQDGKEEIQAYINVYVDDILYVGQEGIIRAIHSWLTEEWKASPLTWASETCSLRFLGLEITRENSGAIRLHQRGYIEELLRHHGLAESKGFSIPCPQEWLLGENDASEEQYDEPQLRRAQALTGELLWLSGKSRPDLLHTVATMSSWCLKCPALVEKIGLRALGYLKETIDIELYYSPRRSDHYIEGFSDASFAPHGSRSVGCCLVGCCLTRYLEQPVAWRCGRQALVALSVAEAELIEAISAAQMSYGIIAVTSELQSAPPTLVLKVDNAAAVGLSSESAGTWKTRHLRVRAYHLREAVRLKEISIEHIPGLNQLGDLGTKAFHRPRLQELLMLWGLKTPGATDGEPSKPSGNLAKVNGTIAILARLAVVLGWLVQASRASPTEGEVGLQVSFPWELYGLAVIALIAAIGAWEALKWCLEWFSLKQSGSVQDARQARRLRRLQQAVSEEVARYGLDDLGLVTQAPSTPLASARGTPRPSPARSVPEVRAVHTVSAAVQTDFDDGYRPFNGPFVVSEHGDYFKKKTSERWCYGFHETRTWFERPTDYKGARKKMPPAPDPWELDEEGRKIFPWPKSFAEIASTSVRWVGSERTMNLIMEGETRLEVCFPPLPLADLDWNLCDVTETRVVDANIQHAIAFAKLIIKDRRSFPQMNAEEALKAATEGAELQEPDKIKGLLERRFKKKPDGDLGRTLEVGTASSTVSPKDTSSRGPRTGSVTGTPSFLTPPPHVVHAAMWICIASEKELPAPGGVCSFPCSGRQVAVLRGKDGDLYAADDALPPLLQPLSGPGVQFDGRILRADCAASGTKFDLRNGEVMGAWCPGRGVRTLGEESLLFLLFLELVSFLARFFCRRTKLQTLRSRVVEGRFEVLAESPPKRWANPLRAAARLPFHSRGAIFGCLCNRQPIVQGLFLTLPSWLLSVLLPERVLKLAT